MGRKLIQEGGGVKVLGSVVAAAILVSHLMTLSGSPASANDMTGKCVKQYRWVDNDIELSEVFRVARNSACKDLNAWWAMIVGHSVQLRGQYVKNGRWAPGALGFRTVPSQENAGPNMQVLILHIKDGTKVRGQLRPKYMDPNHFVYFVH